MLLFFQKTRKVGVHGFGGCGLVDVYRHVRMQNAGGGEQKPRPCVMVGQHEEGAQRAVGEEIAVERDALGSDMHFALARRAGGEHPDAQRRERDKRREKQVAEEYGRDDAARRDQAERPVPVGAARSGGVRGRAPGNGVLARHCAQYSTANRSSFSIFAVG